MKFRPSSLSTLLLVCLLGVGYSAILTTVSEERSLAVVNHVAGHTETWDGTVSLQTRTTAAWLGSAAAFLGVAALATCTAAGIFAGPIPCGIVVFTAAVGFIWSAFGAVLSASSRRSLVSDESMNGYYVWDRPALADGMTVYERARFNYVAANDSLPIHVGETRCDEGQKPCLSIWYEQRPLPNRRLHHVHVAPRHFDYRGFVASRTEKTITRTRLAARQTESETGTTTAPNGGPEYYGGYMWDEGSSSDLSSIYAIGQSGFTSQIANEMLSDSQSSGMFNDTGTYCMDFDVQGDSSAGTLGFFYFYDSPSGFPSGSESGIYNTCSEEAA